MHAAPITGVLYPFVPAIATNGKKALAPVWLN
jgi:hypothetical protein